MEQQKAPTRRFISVQKLRPDASKSPRQNSPRPHEQRKLSRNTIIRLEDGKSHNLSYDDLELGKLLGSGQYGTVTRCTHAPTGLTMAIKRINASTYETDDQKSQLMDLDVPMKTGSCDYTVKFYGALYAEGYIWILTECMDTSLDKFYMQATSQLIRLSETFISRVAFSVLSGLLYLKNLKIMHRDVKPSNILINSRGQIKLCDFGISGFMTNSKCQTKEKGCRPYMAPEKIDQNTNDGYSVKSDIWSLGISLIEIATGKHPYADIGNYFHQIQAICHKDPPRLSSNEFSQDLCEFVSLCLMKDFNQRGSLDQLLEHNFIKKHSNDTLDLELIQNVIQQVQEDNDEDS